MTAPLHSSTFDTASQSTPPCHDALDLTGLGKKAQIVLNDMVYTLTITRAGKLILTK
ncbi:hemin uptake protein HemP [Aliiroseovarius sediminis]|uniref:hemin uptake protein HemP n=1 Tax=Aliiroseovarius sediminis TaxID=2925839 RepID=UPI001F569931|nr:hemin uptake protein HemP [Aliiroseovarius sediminis]MCI2393436.1 hemin uptake protein HemP [Aliiroseovarius sediminis]